jgi:hypothetical protein
MVEPRRKHGPFDPRYPLLTKPPTPTWVLDADAGLEWTAFLARFFPGSRRHDIDALAAYGAYRNASGQESAAEPGAPVPTRNRGSAVSASKPTLLQPAQAPAATKTRRVRAKSSSAAVSAWEGEGGGPR